VEPALGEIVLRQEFLRRRHRRNLHHVLRVCEERAVHRERHRHAHPLVLGDAVANEHVFERLLRGGDPAEQPAEIADRHRVVVLHAESAGIVESAIADDEHRRQAVGRRDGERLHAVHPAGAARAAEGARVDRRGVLDDLELRVLAVGDDVLGVECSVSDQLRERVHDFGVRPDRISRDHVDVSQAYALRDRLTAVEQLLALVDAVALAAFGFLHCNGHTSTSSVFLTGTILPSGITSPFVTRIPLPVTTG
jgi:hypothetical protein